MDRQQLAPFGHLGDAIAPPQRNTAQPSIQPVAGATGGLTVCTSLKAGVLLPIGQGQQGLIDAINAALGKS